MRVDRTATATAATTVTHRPNSLKFVLLMFISVMSAWKADAASSPLCGLCGLEARREEAQAITNC